MCCTCPPAGAALFAAEHAALDAAEGAVALVALGSSPPSEELLRAGRAALAAAEARAAALKALRRGVAKAKAEAKEVRARLEALAAGGDFAARYRDLKEKALDAHDDAEERELAFSVAEKALAKAQRRGGAVDPQAVEAAFAVNNSLSQMAH